MEKKYPLKAGYKEQSTSKEAAAKVDSRAAVLRTEAIEVGIIIANEVPTAKCIKYS